LDSYPPSLREVEVIIPIVDMGQLEADLIALTCIKALSLDRVKFIRYPRFPLTGPIEFIIFLRCVGMESP